MSVRRFSNHIKRVPNFPFQYSKVRGCNRLFRIDHNIHVGAIPDCLQSKCFPKPSLHTIPLHRVAQHFANCKPDAQALTLRALQAKNCHMLREVPASLLVYTFKIRAAKQARSVGKLHPLPWTRSTPRGDGSPVTIRKLTIVATHQRVLLSETWLHGDPLSTFGAPARDYGLAAFGFHPPPKSVRLRAMAAVRLKRALWHEK
jgi:hypothetical protein